MNPPSPRARLDTGRGATWGARDLLLSTPPEVLFLISATAQYSGAVIAVGLFDRVAPSTVAWVRVLSAALFLLVASRGRGHRRWTARDAAWACAFGTVTALMNLFFYLAIDRLPLGKGVTIEFIGPIAVAALTTRSTRNTAALLAASIGVVVLGGVEVADDPLGIVFILIASIMWAGYIVAGSRVALGDRGVAGLGMGLLVGGLVITPVGARDIASVFSAPDVMLAAVLVGLLSSAVGYGIDQFTLRRIPIRRFSVMLALLPVCAAVFGFAFLGQVPSPLDLAGMALVLVGVATQEREEISRPREPHPST